MIRHLPLLLKVIFFFSVFLFAILIAIRIFFLLISRQDIFTIQNAPKAETAIIFGAGLKRDGSPTPVLMDRVKAGVDLYLSGNVKKLLLTGDNRFDNHNEPASMAVYAQSLGVPLKDIIIDNGGISTFDSCYRARHVFGIKQAILVTQTFHLPRALFVCEHLGIDSKGVSADLRQYWFSSQIIWNIREIPACAAALFDTWIKTKSFN
jgi:SanA protein